MSEKKVTRIKIPVSNSFQYLKVWGGLFELTISERQMLAVILDTENAFSTEGRKVLREKMSFTSPNTVNVYIKNLKDKKAVLAKNGGYIVNPVLNPTDSLTIDFIWNS